MNKKLFRKNLVIGAISLLIFIAITPAFNSCVLNIKPLSIETEYSNNDDYTNMGEEIVVPDDYTTIQEAIDNANDGDKINVREGTYEENIVVNKVVDIIGEGYSSTIIDGGGKGHTVHVTGIGGISISFFKICNSGAGDAGILIDSYANKIEMNFITNNGFGIMLDSTMGNKIINNWISENLHQGIWLGSSRDNEFFGNKINDNDDGMIIDASSTENKISGNVIADNKNIGALISTESKSNTFIGNKFIRNQAGIIGGGASDLNVFHHNDLNENGVNAEDSSDNTWNSSTEGNHWSNYDEDDEGAYDNNSDGIVDSPYNITGGENQDFFPLTISPIPGKPIIKGPPQVLSGKQATYNISTPEEYRIYDEVFYQVYWDNGDYWETSAGLVNTTTGTKESHIWTPKNIIKSNGQKIYNVLVRAFIEIEGFRVYSEDSEAFTVTVTPRAKNVDYKKNVRIYENFEFPKDMSKANYPKECDIIVPVDYNTIQEAIDNANDGDTICVLDGIYEEDIIIEEKNLTLIGNGSDYTIIQGQGQNENVVTIINANNVEITGFQITNGKSLGMYLDNTHGCIIHDNYFGDSLSDSLFVVYSQDAIITNNEFENCGLGIYGNKLEDFIHTVENNSVNGLELVYGKNINGWYISGIQYDFGSIILVNCTNVVIDGLDDLKNTHVGIELAYCSTEVTVKNCIDVSNNYYGIYVYNCYNTVKIHDNEIYENELYGIHLRKSSIPISNNKLYKNEYGISLWESSGCHIEKNDVSENKQAGIYLHFSHNNEIGKDNWVHKNTNGIDIYSSFSNFIHNNTVEKNSYNGIFFKNASYNTLLWNIIEHNALDGEENDVRSGIELKDNSCCNKIEYNNISFQEFWGVLIHDNSNGNMIYHNIFYFNGHFWQFGDRHAYDECINIWDNGYPEDYEDFEYEHGETEECGNSYSHFLPIDFMRGPFQNEEGKDGIIDNSYTIPPGNNVERYPFRQNLLFPEDDIEPEIIPIYPFPGSLHINLLELHILGRSTLVISLFQENLSFNAKANEPYGAKWQSNFVTVSYELKKPRTNQTFNSGEIKFNIFGGGYYRWRLPKKPLLGLYELKITAKDSAGNTKDYTLAPLYIIKIP